MKMVTLVQLSNGNIIAIKDYLPELVLTEKDDVRVLTDFYALPYSIRELFQEDTNAAK